MNPLLFRIVIAFLISTLCATPVFSVERLVIPGTGDSQKLLRVAASQFMEDHTDLIIDIPDSVGSIGGIKRVLNGHAPIARIARPLNAMEKNSGLKSMVFAYTPVVLVANLPGECIDSLSKAEIVGIYSGEITSWHELGDCVEHKIYIANREEGDSSRLLIEENIPGFNKIEKFVGEIIYSTPEALHIIEDHQYTIGYLPLAMLKNSPLARLAINGLQPTAENLSTNKYPLAVPLGFTWKDEPTGASSLFIEFLFSPRGQEIIQAHDAVPSPKSPGF